MNAQRIVRQVEADKANNARRVELAAAMKRNAEMTRILNLR
jgi:hypothetical protein